MTSSNMKTTVYAEFKKLRPDLTFSTPLEKCTFTMKREAFEIRLQDETTVWLGAHRAHRGYAAGSFAAYSGFSVRGGSLYRSIERALGPRSPFRKDLVAQSTSSSLVPDRLHDYIFEDETQAEGLARLLADDVRRWMLPVLRGFAEDFDEGLDRLLTSIEVVRAAENPFTLAIAMMGMLGSRAKLDELVDTAQRHEEFYDFHQAGEDGTATVDETVAALLADT
jgi:hypothetical protein